MSQTLPIREYDRAVNSEIERLLYQNKVIDMDGQGLASGLDDEQFNWVPAPGQWSVGQCIAHLNETHRRWQSLIAEAISDARAKNLLGDGPYAYGFLPRMFLRLTEPPPKLRLKAPKAFRPESRVPLETAMNEFRQYHSRLDELIHDADGVDLARVKVASAFSRHVRFSLGMALWILTTHDRRHLWQVRQVRLSAGFPSGS